MAGIAMEVVTARPDWDFRGVERILHESYPLAGNSLAVLRTAALAAANDRTVRTPMAISWDKWYTTASAVAAFGVERLSGDLYCVHGRPIGTECDLSKAFRCAPTDYLYCPHGVNVATTTVDGAPRCPYCRGVTRHDRNDRAAGPNRLCAHT
jgi:hypothetical protein